MTVQVSISAHANGATGDEQRDNEKAFLDALAGVVETFRSGGNDVYGAQANTQHHGVSVDLMGQADTDPEQAFRRVGAAFESMAKVRGAADAFRRITPMG